MKRIGNAETISDIEFAIDAQALGDRRHAWTAHGVACTRERHRYSGKNYEFTIEVVDLQRKKGNHVSWHALLVTELWQRTDGDGEIRGTKWLKIIEGKSSDIKTWMRSSCSLKLKETGQSGHSRH